MRKSLRYLALRMASVNLVALFKSNALQKNKKILEKKITRVGIPPFDILDFKRLKFPPLADSASE